MPAPLLDSAVNVSASDECVLFESRPTRHIMSVVLTDRSRCHQKAVRRLDALLFVVYAEAPPRGSVRMFCEHREMSVLQKTPLQF